MYLRFLECITCIFVPWKFTGPKMTWLRSKSTGTKVGGGSCWQAINFQPTSEKLKPRTRVQIRRVNHWSYTYLIIWQERTDDVQSWVISQKVSNWAFWPLASFFCKLHRKKTPRDFWKIWTPLPSHIRVLGTAGIFRVYSRWLEVNLIFQIPLVRKMQTRTIGQNKWNNTWHLSGF